MIVRFVPWLAASLVMLAVRALGAPSEEDKRVYEGYLTFPTLVRGGEVEPHWLADGGFWYRDVASERLLSVDARSGTQQPLLDRARLRAALGSPGEIPWAAVTPAADGRSVHVELDGRSRTIDLASYREVDTPAAPAHDQPRVVTTRFPYPAPPLMEVASPDGRWFASLKANDIWLRQANSGQYKQLTSGATADSAWGVVDFLTSWALFSPDGRYLAAMHHDYTGVHRTPMVDWISIPESFSGHPYPLPGKALPQSRLVLLDTETGAQHEIDSGTGEYYLRPIAFVRGGRELLLARLSRDCKQLVLLAADVPSGRTRVVISEASQTFIDWSPSFLGRGPEMTLLPDGESLLWLSERDGWRHFYLYTLDGELVRQVTRGKYPVAAVAGVDWRNRRVYFQAHTDPQRFFDTHIMRADLASGRNKVLTSRPGHHRALLAPNGATFLDIYSTVTEPPVTELRRDDGTLVTEIARADITKLRAVGWTPPEEVLEPGADGTLLHGVLFRPYDFDASRRYPVVELIYAGSQAAWRVNTFVPREVIGGEMMNLLRKGYALAQLGFIVAVTDARGTPGRSKQFHDTIYRKLGSLVVEDHAAVLRNAARTRPYMDMERVGIYGLSFGGYYTVRAMLLAPDLYKVGVAAGAAEFGTSIRASGGEVYLDLLERNPEGFAASANAPLASHLQGKLLMIIGTHDTNTPFSHTMRLADAFVRADKRFDMLVVPGQNHAFMYDDGKPPDLYWWRRTIDYLVEHLDP